MKKQKVDLDKTYKQLLQTTSSKPPAKVKGGYLSQAEATALFYSLSGIQWDILYNRYGLAILRRTKTYYEGDLQAATNYMNEYGDKGAKPIPFTQAPQELQDLRKGLQRDYPKLPLSVCYINYYYSGKATIGWHQDREEHHCPYPMLMATVYGQGKGVTRNFCVLQMNGSKGVAAWGVPTNHGELIETPIGFHDNYFHSVRKERAFTLPRISLTFRNVDLSPNGKWFWHGLKPQVWDCHAKKAYPPDAVYVGCTTRDRRGKVIRVGTFFGNAQRLVAAEGKNIRYCYENKRWFVWDGRIWSKDDSGKIYRLARQTAKGMLHEAADLQDEEERKLLVSHEQRCEPNAGIECQRSHRNAHGRLPRLRSGTHDLQNDVSEQRSGATTQQYLRVPSTI